MKSALRVALIILLLALEARSDELPERVSLTAVISNPEKYEGKKIAVTGWLHLEFEGNALYIHREDYVHSLSGNGIWVDAAPEHGPLSDSYVIAYGTFTAKDKGHMGWWSGRLRNITTIKQWSTLQNPAGLPRPSPLKPKP